MKLKILNKHRHVIYQIGENLIQASNFNLLTLYHLRTLYGLQVLTRMVWFV